MWPEAEHSCYDHQDSSSSFTKRWEYEILLVDDTAHCSDPVLNIVIAVVTNKVKSLAREIG
jgi:hypothetical protein